MSKPEALAGPSSACPPSGAPRVSPGSSAVQGQPPSLPSARCSFTAPSPWAACHVAPWGTHSSPGRQPRAMPQPPCGVVSPPPACPFRGLLFQTGHGSGSSGVPTSCLNHCSGPSTSAVHPARLCSVTEGLPRQNVLAPHLLPPRPPWSRMQPPTCPSAPHPSAPATCSCDCVIWCGLSGTVWGPFSWIIGPSVCPAWPVAVLPASR